jgi:hypothetical protein
MDLMPIRRDELMMGGLQGKQGNAIIIGEGRKITIPGRLGTELKETHLVCKVDRKLGGVWFMGGVDGHSFHWDPAR